MGRAGVFTFSVLKAGVAEGGGHLEQRGREGMGLPFLPLSPTFHSVLSVGS